ncbi:MAG: sigma-54-dependent Fis family transcriptional regulator [Planctomycetes bacterium]|nr:sigma-54-dependent Fis family transcriptional regulator [Planctomycetota bacterium]
MATVLVIDDEQSIIWAFERFITTLGHRFLSAPTAEQGIEIARRERPDLIIVDVKLPGMSGLDALEHLRKHDGEARVIVITAHGSLDTALRATKLGAVEYLAKPIDLVRARRLIDDALAPRPADREVERLRGEVGGFGRIIGKTSVMQDVFRNIAAVCDSDATVLLIGESGTGKEMLARAIHANSRHGSGPFEAINCSSIPETLLESELYGHERGAFSGAARLKQGKFEIAHGGTAFLDEVGELAPTAQVKLLRFLEERSFTRLGGTELLSVDVRIVSATNQDLDQRIREGKFREDLYFRLNVVKLRIPPLRERKDDIPLLVAHFLEHSGAAGIGDAAMEILRAHAWPGNVRELKNAIEHGAVLARGKPIQPEHLPETVLRPLRSEATEIEARIARIVDQLVAGSPAGDLFRHVEAQWERALLKRVLDQVGGNQVKASELLGINRVTLRKKIQQYGL